jgi:hypothetical protein
MSVLTTMADVAHKTLVAGLLGITVVSGVFVFGSMGDIFKRSYDRRQQAKKAADEAQ